MSRSQDDKGSVMFRKFLISLLFLCAFCSMVSFAAGKKMIQVDSAYVEGKVNDPVTKSARVAYIVTENPTVSFDLPEGKKAEVFSYCNSYLESEDRGIRNRLLRKTEACMTRQITVMYCGSMRKAPTSLKSTISEL